MSDRVDTELRRVSAALAAVSPAKPDLAFIEGSRAPRRLGLQVALGAFVLVLAIGVVASLIGRDELPAGIVEIPDGHSGLVAVERGITYGEIPDFAVERGAEFLCGSGMDSLRACVVWEDRVAVVIPFSVADGVTGEIRTPSHDGPVEIPLVEGTPVGVRHDAGQLTLVYRVPGEETPSSFGTDFPTPSGP